MPVVRSPAAAVFNVPDAGDNLRLECLRLAAALGGTRADVLATAEAFFDFVRPRKAAEAAAIVPVVSP